MPPKMQFLGTQNLKKKKEKEIRTLKKKHQTHNAPKVSLCLNLASQKNKTFAGKVFPKSQISQKSSTLVPDLQNDKESSYGLPNIIKNHDFDLPQNLK